MTGKPHATAGKGWGGRKGKKKRSNTDRVHPFRLTHPLIFPAVGPLSTDRTSDRFPECILKPGTPHCLAPSLARSLALPARLHAILLKPDRPARSPPREEVTSTGAPSFPCLLALARCRLNWTSVGQYCVATQHKSDFIIRRGHTSNSCLKGEIRVP